MGRVNGLCHRIAAARNQLSHGLSKDWASVNSARTRSQRHVFEELQNAERSVQQVFAESIGIAVADDAKLEDWNPGDVGGRSSRDQGGHNVDARDLTLRRVLPLGGGPAATAYARA